MDIVLDRKELIKYPFLKESQQLARQHVESLEAFLSSGPGGIALERAKDRVIAAFTHKREFPEGNTQNLKPELEIASYALARVLVSCSGNRSLIDRLRATRRNAHPSTWRPRTQSYSGSSPGASVSISKRPPCRSPITSSWCRTCVIRAGGSSTGSAAGMVHLGPGEIDELIRERIRVVLVDQMPLRVPAAICERLEPITEEISAAYQQQILEQFGEVQEEAFPPCISALIQAIATGTNISHMGRFAVTSFLHTIGMSGTGIVEMFAQAPDFDLEKTMYQVDHISGGGGTE